MESFVAGSDPVCRAFTVRYRFNHRRYRLPFRAPVRTAHGVWGEREGVLIRLEEEGGGVGLGEAAPIPWFGTETVDEVDAACRELGEWVESERIDAVPVRLGCLRNAFAAAVREVGRVSDPPSNTPDLPGRVKDPPYRGIAALLPAGRAALVQIEAKAESGFRVFKWKVGVGDIAEELGLLDDLCGKLPSGAKLRLDANGAWDRRRAGRWLERCAERPVEFIEQPCFAEASQGAAARARIDDILLGLAADYPTPIGLDESLVGEGDIERWLGAGWSGVFVVKPSLLADVDSALARLAKAKARVVFSSALETAVGARAALRAALAWPGEPLALGFGVWPLFADARFDGPAGAPFVRAEDVERINVDAAWNALN
jgi:O-succinylbenzoate synthase